MELFVHFCEDTVFEMQLAAQISGSESGEELKAKDDKEEKDKVENNQNHIVLKGWIIGIAKEMKVADLLGDLRDTYHV